LKRDIDRCWTMFGCAVYGFVGASVLPTFMFGVFIQAAAAENHGRRAQVHPA
jgi:hypothetical protein